MQYKLFLFFYVLLTAFLSFAFGQTKKSIDTIGIIEKKITELSEKKSWHEKEIKLVADSLLQVQNELLLLKEGKEISNGVETYTINKAETYSYASSIAPRVSVIPADTKVILLDYIVTDFFKIKDGDNYVWIKAGDVYEDDKVKAFILSIHKKQQDNKQQEKITNTAGDSIPCRIDIKVDSYSGKKTIETGFIDFNGGTYLLSKNKGIINFWIQIESSIVLTIEAGEIFYIKLTDNTVIKFAVSSTDISDYSSSTDRFTNSFSFNLTGTKLEQLKTMKIQGIKCYINEYTFTDFDGEKFKNNLNCIVKAK